MARSRPTPADESVSFSKVRAVARSLQLSPEPRGGLRERKKQATRTLLSDTATAMFLQRGFDDVRVAEIAEACGVSEKTVYNYFPTKEALLLDEEEEMAVAVGDAMSSWDVSPVDAMLTLLESKMRGLGDAFDEQGGAAAMTMVGHFSDLIESTPSLRAYHRDAVDRLVRIAADGLATRTGLPADTPELQLTAFALVALWRIQIQSLQRHAAGGHTPAEVTELVIGDVRRAARLIDTGASGLWRAHRARRAGPNAARRASRRP
ncbi:TetR/AcrR family transcriptional regulator [Jatrophihabitans endophyticus]|uniref:TetR/AcrR family transcriptional regulator n=1 Tax=Jatrophihabitans endophyticus TaxID=1206085 RepID=UPI0019E7D69D|nr:TetR/AcrR family transcriptional regulator [Jatrophihabitans endophyticus]MBE7187760.1 TetR/AcrR family transcriptional regulator [Jatrophihabitans endophyticus]